MQWTKGLLGVTGVYMPKEIITTLQISKNA